MSKMKQELQQAISPEATQVSQQTGLTPIQEQAAILLASGETITAVAAKIGVNRGTIYDWQGIVTFQCFFNQQKHDYKEHLKNSLFGLTNDALTAVRNCLHSDNEATRLKAATWLLEKVAEQKTGETNARAVIRAQCTSGVDDWGTLTHFDDKAYKTECKRLGITPEKL